MHSMIEKALIELTQGKWDGRTFEVEIDPDTMEPVSPLTVSQDGNTVTDRHGRVVGKRYFPHGSK
jgi:hypothetical protein